MKPEYASTCTQPEDMQKSREWTSNFTAGPEGLPLSFVLDGKAVRGIPESWKPVSMSRRIDANIMETVHEGTDPATGLSVRVECTQYLDYPVVEWVGWFTNQGHHPTPLIRDILAMDGAFKGDAPVLYHCNGDVDDSGYRPQETPLHAAQTLRFAPNGGRSCDGAFPYYRIMFDGGGLSIAIGWPGQWAASFTAQAGGVHVRAGQEQTNLCLMPGETIRTPRMTVLSWTGDVSRAVNLWRRWYLAHVLPRHDGQPLGPMLGAECPGDGGEFTAATEQNQLWGIEAFRRRGIRPDIWWIDAGWYECCNEAGNREWPITGTWEIDRERFPRGLRPVSALAASDGTDLLVWFEPERVRRGTWLHTEHPEWLLKVEDNVDALLNLGIPACRQWFTGRVCELIRDNGIGIYRQDLNFGPLEHWRRNDPPDRQGINENLHVQGYLQYWDDLLARNPGLWIDACAGGGRRNDLETMRRGVPLHYSDYGGNNPPLKVAFHHTLYAWLPFFKDGTLANDLPLPDTLMAERYDVRTDSYAYHCGMAPMMSARLDIRRDDYDYPLAVRLFDLWRRASHFLLHGDYYPFTPFDPSPAAWAAWQFDSPETGSGLIQGIRFPEAPDGTLTVAMIGICPDATYWFENPESGEKKTIPGSVLAHDGFTFALPQRSAAIWFYRIE